MLTQDVPRNFSRCLGSGLGSNPAEAPEMTAMSTVDVAGETSGVAKKAIQWCVAHASGGFCSKAGFCGRSLAEIHHLSRAIHACCLLRMHMRSAFCSECRHGRGEFASHKILFLASSPKDTFSLLVRHWQRLPKKARAQGKYAWPPSRVFLCGRES